MSTRCPADGLPRHKVSLEHEPRVGWVACSLCMGQAQHPLLKTLCMLVGVSGSPAHLWKPAEVPRHNTTLCMLVGGCSGPHACKLLIAHWSQRECFSQASAVCQTPLHGLGLVLRARLQATAVWPRGFGNATQLGTQDFADKEDVTYEFHILRLGKQPGCSESRSSTTSSTVHTCHCSISRHALHCVPAAAACKTNQRPVYSTVIV
jgi:hypothetical protein